MTLLDADICGDAVAGSREGMRGRVHDLSVRQSGPGSVHASFDFSAPNEDALQLGVIVDGSLASRVAPSTAQAEALNLAEGLHTLDVRPLYPFERQPDHHNDPQGKRAWLSWEPSTDPSTAAYRVYSDDGEGGTPETLLATLDTVVVETLTLARPTSGTGSGRVSVSGSYTGPGAVNGAYRLEITDDGEAEWIDPDGLTLDTVRFEAAGDSLALSLGVRVTFEDSPGRYDVGDAWDVWIGPQTSFLTDTLEPGTHRFAVLALDAQGNPQEDPPEVKAVRILDVTPAVGSVSLSYDDGTNTLTVEWFNPAGVNTVNVYSNWNEALSRFEEHVILDCCTAVVGDEWQFTPGAAEGTLLFYLRPVKGEVERADLTLHAFSFPPTPTDLGIVLGVPTGLAATAIAGGDVRVEWDYRFRTRILNGVEVEDSLDHFLLVAAQTDGDWDWESPWAIIAADEGQGYPSAHFVAELEENLVALGWSEAFISVRAVAEDGTMSEPAATVRVVPDATGPSAAGALHVVPH